MVLLTAVVSYGTAGDGTDGLGALQAWQFGVVEVMVDLVFGIADEWSVLRDGGTCPDLWHEG
jgi:hypothetical protein